MNKKCSICNATKSLSEFYFKNKSKGTYQHKCKNCQSAYYKQYYQDNYDYRVNKQKDRTKRLKLEVRHYLLSFFSDHPCVDCGETDPLTLEFDHIAGEKKYNVSQIILGTYTLKTVKKEIAKCVVRCANCHNKKTAKEKGYWLYKHLIDGIPVDQL